MKGCCANLGTPCATKQRAKLASDAFRLADWSGKNKIVVGEVAKTRLLMKEVCDGVWQLRSRRGNVHEIVTGSHGSPGMGKIICSGMTDNISSTMSGEAAAIMPPIDSLLTESPRTSLSSSLL